MYLLRLSFTQMFTYVLCGFSWDRSIGYAGADLFFSPRIGCCVNKFFIPKIVSHQNLQAIASLARVAETKPYFLRPFFNNIFTCLQQIVSYFFKKYICNWYKKQGFGHFVELKCWKHEVRESYFCLHSRWSGESWVMFGTKTLLRTCKIRQCFLAQHVMWLLRNMQIRIASRCEENRGHLAGWEPRLSSKRVVLAVLFLLLFPAAFKMVEHSFLLAPVYTLLAPLKGWWEVPIIRACRIWIRRQQVTSYIVYPSSGREENFRYNITHCFPVGSLY